MKDLGLSLAPAAKFPGAGDEGVVITEVDPSSDAADKGLKPGDVILEVAGVNVSDPSDVAEGVKKAMAGAKPTTEKDTVKVLMQVKSGDQTRFVALSLKKAYLLAGGRRGSPPSRRPPLYAAPIAVYGSVARRSPSMRVLVIEDDRETAPFLQARAQGAGHAAEFAGDGETGLDLARANATTC